jgi:NADH-quinone oxidoreductase subunit H
MIKIFNFIIFYFRNTHNNGFKISLLSFSLNFSIFTVANNVLLFSDNRKAYHWCLSIRDYLNDLVAYFFLDFSEFLSSIILFIGLLISVAFYTLLERKLMAATQRRKGPNVTGFFGVLQPIADGVKLILKEPIFPSRSDLFLFYFSPIFTFFIAFLSWSFIPFSEDSIAVDLNYGLIFLLGLSSLGTYGIIFAGWASNSKYAFLGGIRSIAQIISYEMPIGFIFLAIAILSNSFNMIDVVLAQENIWFFIPMWPLALIFSISALAETNRTPFDLPEAEAEIVAGYNVEYSGILFAFFFLGEYANMLLVSALTVILFFGGWLPIFSSLCFIPAPFWMVFKIMICSALIVLARAALPRVRYNTLMHLCWKVFIPLTFSFVVLNSVVVYYFL